MSQTTAKKKDVLTAVLLNLFVPGAGYWYAGRKFLGVIVLLLAAASVAGAMAGSGPAASFAGLLGIVGAVDGYLTVKKHNSKLEEAEQAALVKCPHCAERIQAEAKVCRHCQRNVAPIAA
jgi:hypothetical protein